MQYIYSAQEIHEIDAGTIKEEGITSLDLMERAAAAATRAVAQRWDSNTPIIIFAGPGNNGGDALAMARQLALAGYRVQAYLFNTSGKLSADCQANKVRLEKTQEVSFIEVTHQFEPPKLTKEHLIIDGLFGTGLTKPLSGGYASLVRFINDAPTSVVSIDIPSGLMCDDNSFNIRAHIVKATLTLTFQQPKLSMMLAENAGNIGELEVLDIGLSEKVMEQTQPQAYILTEKDIAAQLRPRPIFGHKGTFGHALIMAGKHGMAGAAILSARACLRSGIGKVTVHTPQMNSSILQIAVPEAVLSLDSGDMVLTETAPLDGFDALAIGPGISMERTTELAFIEQVTHTRIPLVIDADGLNILSRHKSWLNQIPANAILTPHPGELSRLGNCRNDDYSLLTEAVTIAKERHLFIVLKGHHTAICTPSGTIYFNSTGNSGMATAGSGDSLTGIIVALLAQKYTAEAACMIGVYLHGLAGDMAAEALGEDSVTASDIISYLPPALKHLRNTTNNSNH